MHLLFKAINDTTNPGEKWLEMANEFWPSYSNWLNTQEGYTPPSLAEAQAALHHFMPEIYPIYAKLCELANADAALATFLTGFKLPAYITGCSQAIFKKDGIIQVIRNNDYNPDLLEGVFLLSKFKDKKVMGMSDCLFGLLDGVNDLGLSISLSFGGRKEVGYGFGIPIILRYVLETCATVVEAAAALSRIPSHMSYNVIAAEKSGKHKLIKVAPDKIAVVSDLPYTTNHQEKVEWERHARFNQTFERLGFLKDLLDKKDLDINELIYSFLEPPLFNKAYRTGFGTLYTAIYNPVDGMAQLLWKDDVMNQSFDDFKEVEKAIIYEQEAGVPEKKTKSTRVNATEWIHVPEKEAAPEITIPKKHFK